MLPGWIQVLLTAAFDGGDERYITLPKCHVKLVLLLVVILLV